MFKLINLSTIMGIEYSLKDGKSIDFEVGFALGARSRTEVVPEHLFDVLNGYLEYKGEEFQKRLFKEYEKAKEILAVSVLNPGIEPLPTELINGILDMFDLEDMEAYIKRSGMVGIPDMLKTTYDASIEINDLGSREQTYLRSDYYKLAALINVLRAALPPIGEFATMKQGSIPNSHKEYILIHFFTQHPIFESEAFVKLHDYIKKLLVIAMRNEQEFAKRVMERNIPKEEYSVFLLGLVIFQKFMLINETLNKNDKNMVTKLYSFISNKIGIKSMNNSASSIYIKNYHPSNMANVYETESTLETYRTPINISLGHIAEFNHVYRDPFDILNHLGCNKKSELAEVLHYFQTLAIKDIPKENIIILSWITKEIIDPRAIEYIEMDRIVNGLAASFIYLIDIEQYELANLLTAHIVNDDKFKIWLKMKHKLTPENKILLEEAFPNMETVRSNKGITYSSFIEKSITNIVTGLGNKAMISILPVDLLRKYHCGESINVTVPNDIRNILAKVILHLNR